jgi:phosphoserine phosphatase RsbU/P
VKRSAGERDFAGPKLTPAVLRLIPCRLEWLELAACDTETPTGERVTATLQILNGKTAGTKHSLTHPITRIGRHPECEIQIDISAASRFHAHVVKDGVAYLIEDLGSRNKTYVNGKPTEGKVPLQDNDRVKICDLLFVFHADKSAPSAGADDVDGSQVLSTLASASSLDAFKVKPEAKLRAILEISQAMGLELNLDKLLPKMLEGLFKIFPQADRAMVIQRDDHDRLIPKAYRHRKASDDDIRFSRTIVRQAMEQRESILSADALSDERFSLSASLVDMRIRSVIVSPLLVGDRPPYGVMVVDTQSASQKFEGEDLQILSAVANQAAVALEIARMHEETIVQERMNRELTLARDVQRSFVPTTMPSRAPLKFWAYYEAAGAVGGDYYDFINLPGGKTAVMLGDVSGKGVPAALLMAKASSDAKVGLLTHPGDPAGAMSHLNNAICAANLEGKYMTTSLCIVDPASTMIQIVNAGHMSPVIRLPNGNLVEPADPDRSGPPVGVIEDYPYEVIEAELGPGEVVVIFSDGVSDAMNAAGHEYKTARIREVIRKSCCDATELGEGLLADVRRHVAGWEPFDDMTMVVVSRSA